MAVPDKALEAMEQARWHGAEDVPVKDDEKELQEALHGSGTATQ